MSVFLSSDVYYSISAMQLRQIRRGIVIDGCNGRFMQGCSKVPASAHSAYIGVYVYAPASTERRNPLQAIRSLQGHPTGGPSLRDGHSQLSHRIKRIGSAREKRMENDFLVNCSTPFLVASRDSPAPKASGWPTSEARSFAKQSRKSPSDATPCQDSRSREAQNMTT